MATQYSFTITITDAQLEALEARLGTGLSVNTAGILPTYDGVSLGYSIKPADPGSSVVTLTIVKKPFYVTDGMVEDHVKSLAEVEPAPEPEPAPAPAPIVDHTEPEHQQ
jgi:hypothetical protein